MSRLSGLLFFLSITAQCFAYDVVVLGSAIVDHAAFVEDEFLAQVGIEKGGWKPFEYNEIRKIRNTEGLTFSQSPGGSGINVIRGLAELGWSAAAIGKVGQDDSAQFFRRSLRHLGIEPFFTEGKDPTGQVICLVTPDGQRSMCSYLGASHDQSQMVLEPGFFHGARLLHIEGYQLVEGEMIVRAAKMAKQAGCKISLDLANRRLVNEYRHFVNQFLADYVDIVFCNEDEALELTGLFPEEACQSLGESCSIAVVTMGKGGCWVVNHQDRRWSPAMSVTAVDTTGAGDLFASGFLHGFLCGHSLDACALFGTLTASNVVQTVGAELSQTAWQEIKQAMQASPMASVVQATEDGRKVLDDLVKR